jgi:ABC-type sugar transport system ATPase subunit
MPDLLRAENINKRYGGVVALKDAAFELRPGEVHALMGENGAGKSTLAKILAGSVKPDSGRIQVQDEPAIFSSPLDAQRRGISMIYQELDLFPHLTVAENIAIANLRFPENYRVHRRRMEEFCRPFLDQVGLDAPASRYVAELSIGQMQLLAIARALSMDARIILMDEPTSALFDDSVERLFRLIANLKAGGVSVVYVSHKMDEIFRVCDRITVLRDGETVGTRETAATDTAEIVRLMVGREIQMSTRAEQTQTGPTLLTVKKLSTPLLRNISFELARGEVLGIAGLVGSGRSELGLALSGLDPITSGSIQFAGKPGIALVPEDRKLSGLMMQMSVLENSTLGVISRFSRFGFIRAAEELRAAEPHFQNLALKARSLNDPVNALSGGNQQKVLLTKCLLADPEVIFLDDPARGIDIGAKQDIYRIIRELAGAGKGVLLVSSELPELLHCSTRIMVLCEGRVTGFFDAATTTQEAIMTAATAVHAGDIA